MLVLPLLHVPPLPRGGKSQALGRQGMVPSMSASIVKRKRRKGSFTPAYAPSDLHSPLAWWEKLNTKTP